MPTYEYRCKSCGHGLEVVQAFTDEPLTRCPSCKKKQLRKVFGSIGITFKGSGFYKTDSRSGSSSSSSSSDGTSSADGATTTETKAEPKADKAGTTATTEKKAGKGDAKTAASTKP